MIVINAGDFTTVTTGNHLVLFAKDTYPVEVASNVDTRSTQVNNQSVNHNDIFNGTYASTGGSGTGTGTGTGGGGGGGGGGVGGGGAKTFSSNKLIAQQQCVILYFSDHFFTHINKILLNSIYDGNNNNFTSLVCIYVCITDHFDRHVRDYITPKYNKLMDWKPVIWHIDTTA